MLCYKCQNTIPDYSLVCTNCGAEQSVLSRNKAHAGTDSAPIPNIAAKPMKWFNFLIYFYLFYEAASSYMSGITYILGSFMNISKLISDSMSEVAISQAQMPEIVFTCCSQFGSQFRVVDIIYGLLLFGFAAWAIILRFKLAKRKKNAPKLLLWYLSVPAVVSSIYNVVYMIISKTTGPEQIILLAMMLAVQGAIVSANYTYFKKREELFEN